MVDRGATSGLRLRKPNVVSAYMNQMEGVKYTKDGQIVSHSLADNFNKKFIANLNPKTLPEELNIGTL